MLAELGLRDVRQGVPVWGGALSANVVAARPDGRGQLAFVLAEDAMFSRCAYDGDGLGRPTGTLRATQRLLAAAGYRVRRAVSVSASGVRGRAGCPGALSLARVRHHCGLQAAVGGVDAGAGCGGGRVNPK